MAQYYSQVNATSNATANTEDSFLDITPPAGVRVKIKRIRVSYGGTAAVGDNTIRVLVKRKSAQGAGSVAGTVVKKDPRAANAASTVQIKSGTTAFGVGTIVDTFGPVQFNQRGIFEFVARDEDDYIESGVAQIIGVNCQVTAASIILNVEVEWVE